ncbi:YbaB/EbfC family nucleoid-associated protein [Saccharopolyspora sp. 5N708]|uniref:YbaB/EbfC family nucleoid-associated protein n=1 Tax=Saccharopolyspora sp. 5N708 TaxID=3457424 RepID=UPI003FCFCF6F
MSEVDRRGVEMLREEYERQLEGINEMRRRLTALSATAVSPKREVSVTVAAQGVITELKFLTSAYRRLPPNELADLVTRTIAEARDKVTEQTAEIMAPMLPPGMDAKSMLTGALTAGELAPSEASLPPLIRERMNRRI